MLKKTVTYNDFDNNQRTETLYFNMTQSEIVEFAMELPDKATSTIGSTIDGIDEQQVAMELLEELGGKSVVSFIKKLLLKAYGIKSEDGRRFMKSAEISKEFSETLAFDKIFMELMSDDESASAFVKAVIPAEVIDKMPIMSPNNVIKMDEIETAK